MCRKCAKSGRSNSVLILVLDSSGASCGVCVWRDGQVLSRAEEHMQRGQDARLMPMVMEAMAQAGCAFSELDRIAVTRGPGSFTGMRVGLAAARGLGLATGKPVIGIDRFSVYKSLHTTPENLLVVIDSRRADLFCQFFPAQSEAFASCMMTEQKIAAFLAAHPDTEIAGDIATPDADILSASARLTSNADPQSPDFSPRPFYLRPPDVTFAKTKC